MFVLDYTKMTNRYLEKLAEKHEKPSFGERAGKAYLSSMAAGAAGAVGASHFANKLEDRAGEANHFIHKRTISKMVRHNKLDVGLRGNPFGKKNKFTKTDGIRDLIMGKPKSSFIGHDNAYIPKWMHGGKRDHVYATNRGAAIHELGHATAYKHSKLPKTRYMSRTGAAALGSFGGAGLILSGDKDKAKYAPAVAAAPLAFNLWDEGAANVHAYKALKKHQTKAHANRYLRRFITPQMANYTAASAIPLAGAALAYKWIYGKKKEKHNAT